MRIRKLDTRLPRDVRSFINFPFELYRDCPQWVPPLVADIKTALNREKHPFYRHSEADFLIAESESQVLGRIVVFESRPYNDFHGTKAAFFHFFEVIDDIEVSRAILNAAFEWARKHGLDAIWGPTGLSRSDGRGMLVEGFEHRPALGIPYNFAYYDAFVKGSGFEKSHDYLSGYFSADYELPQRFYDIAERVKVRRGYRIRSFTSKKELRQLGPALLNIYNDAFVQVWGYYPVGLEDVQAMIDRLIPIADPRLIKLVMKGDEAIGFVFAFPDVSEAIQRAKGRLWPFGWIHLMLEPRRTKWVSFNGVGVLPKYQGVGANAVLYAELAKTFASNDFQFEHGDYAQVAETNLESLGDANILGMPMYKRHRVYRKTL